MDTTVKPPAITVRTVRAQDVRVGDVVRWRRPTGTMSPWGPVVRISTGKNGVLITIGMATMDFPVELRLYDLLEWQEEA